MLNESKEEIVPMFKKLLPKLKIDKKFKKRVEIFKLEWMNKNSDHIEFLGGNLLGVNRVIFSSLDEDNFFIDVVHGDKSLIISTIKSNKLINSSWIVSSNHLYLTLGYLMHETLLTKELNNKEKDELLESLYMIFAFKTISSLISWYFKFTLDKDIAIVVYENLSKKYLIKRLDNWYDVFKYRSNDVKLKGLHYDKIKRFNVDDSVLLLNDLQGRIRDTVKNIYKVTRDIIDNRERITVTTLDNQLEDGDISTILNRPDMYIKYIDSIISKENDFIKSDLIYVIGDLIKNIDKEELRTTLKYLSYQSLHDHKIIDLIDEMMKLNIEYLVKKNNMGEYESNIESILIHLKGFWSASKIKNSRVKKVKKEMVKYTKEALNRNTQRILITTSAGVYIYVYLRAISKNIYK